MTRVTKQLRYNMERDIMKDLPSRDYTVEIYKLVQDTIADQLPTEVKSLYDNEDLRKYIVSSNIEVFKGNTSVGMYSQPDVYGLAGYLRIRMDDAEHANRLPEGSPYAAVVMALAASGLVDGYFEQEELRSSVMKGCARQLGSSQHIQAAI